MEIKEYFKWLFSRWYLYGLSLFTLVYSRSNSGESINLATDLSKYPEVYLGGFLGNILVWAIVFSVIIEIKKLFSFLFTSRNTSNSKG